MKMIPQKVTNAIPIRPTGDTLNKISAGYHYTHLRWNVEDSIESRETHCDFIDDLNQLLDKYRDALNPEVGE